MAKSLFWVLMLIIALVPLPLGSDQQWASSLLAATLGIVLLLWSLVAWRDRELVRLRRQRIRAQTWVFGIVILWFFIQTSGLTPVSWHHPVWQGVGQALDLEVTGRIALAPEAALRTIMRLLCYAGAFWLVMHYSRREGVARQVLWVIAVSGAGYAIYGLIVHLGGYGTIVWLEKWGYIDSLTSTFLNRSTYATYAGLGLITSLALLLEYALRQPITDPLQKLSAGSSEQWGFGPWFLSANIFVIGTALLLSNSRAGLAASLCGVACLFVMTVLSGRLSRRKVITFGAGLLLLTSLLIGLSGSSVLQRFTEFDKYQDAKIGDFGRQTIYEWTAEQIAEEPLLGRGLGGFSGTFYAERDARFGDTPKTYSRAHNTYLEMALDAGLPAALALLAVIGSLAWTSFRSLRRQDASPIYPILGLSATVLVGLHALYDFSMEVPAVALTYFAILGCVTAQSWPRPRLVQRSARPPASRPRGDQDRAPSEPLQNGPEAADRAPI